MKRNGWITKHLKDVAPLQRGFDLTKAELREGSVPVISSSGFWAYHDEAKVSGPGIVIGRYGTLGEVFFVQEDFWPHNTTLWVTDFCGNDPYFVNYLYRSLDISKHSAKTGVPGLNRNDLHTLKIAVPPLPEQQKIAAILSTWDRAIELTEKLIAAKQKRKQALMQQLLTGKVRFKEFTKLGEWRVTKLGSVAVKVGSGITPRGGQSTYLASGVPFIRSQNVLSGKLDLTDIAYLSEEQHSQMENSQVQPLDVLLNITGASIGRCAKVPAGFPTANVNQHVCIIRPKETLDPDYLSNLLNSWFGQKLVFQSQAGGNREGLNYEQIRSFKFVLPPIAEQRRLGELLAASDAEIEVLHRKVDRLKQQKRGLMQQLLTGKVRVNVDAETVKG